MATSRFTGRSGQVWARKAVLLHPSAAGPSAEATVARARGTAMVQTADTEQFGALRTFPDRRSRDLARMILAGGSPTTPALLDVVDVEDLPPALVTAWAPGSSQQRPAQLREPDDLAAMLDSGHRWAPSEALRMLVPLGRALDQLAARGLVPIELSPDHLVVNSGSIVLIGIGRHGYLPEWGTRPDPEGMSLPTTLLLGDDLPGRGRTDHRSPGDPTEQWRLVQVRALARLAGWMACGLAPSAWGSVLGQRDLEDYLHYAGFVQAPALRPQHLADSLAEAAHAEEKAQARRRIERARAVLLYDHVTHRDSSRGINPESLRLGLLREHGPDVLALAAFESKQVSQLAAQLSGAGWILVDRTTLVDVVPKIRAAAPQARLVVAGRPRTYLRAVLPPSRRGPRTGGPGVEIVDLNGSGPAPVIAGRPAGELPFLDDPTLKDYQEQVLGKAGGHSRRRRTFAAGWSYVYGLTGPDRSPRLPEHLELLSAAFGTNVELLIAVRCHLNAPGLVRKALRLTSADLTGLVTALSGVPFGAFRQHLLSALLGEASEALDDAIRRLLPVAGVLADVYDPQQPIAPDGLCLQDALQEVQGMYRVGLFGRLCAAMPDTPPPHLAGWVAAMDDPAVAALADVPAPSLRYLVGRLQDGADLAAAMQPHLHRSPRTAFGRLSPDAWALLLDGPPHPQHVDELGLGWLQVAAHPSGRDVDPNTLLAIARDASTTPAAAVQALLALPAHQWRTVCAHPDLSARWLTDRGRLDIAPLLDRFPQAARLTADMGSRVVDHAAELELDQAAFLRLDLFARKLPVRVGRLLTIWQQNGYTAEHAVLLDQAAIEWAQDHLPRRLAHEDRDQALAWTVGNIVERRQKIVEWALEGAHLPERIAADVLGPDADLLSHQDLKEQVSRWRARPDLLPLLRTVRGATARSVLLDLYERHPDAFADARVLRSLPQLLTDRNPEAALLWALSDVHPAAAHTARRLHLTVTHAQVLDDLGPLLDSLPDPALAALAQLGTFSDRTLVHSAAVLEQDLPGTATVVLAWGTVWLPLLAGPNGSHVLQVLNQHAAQFSSYAATLTPWLLGAGGDGITLVARMGAHALDLILRLGPPPGDASLLLYLMSLPGPTDQLYRLIVAHRLPSSVWSHVGQALAAGWDERSILLSLGDREPAP